MKITFYQKEGGGKGFSESSVLTVYTFQYGELCSWKNIICTLLAQAKMLVLTSCAADKMLFLASLSLKEMF